MLSESKGRCVMSCSTLMKPHSYVFEVPESKLRAMIVKLAKYTAVINVSRFLA